MKNVLMITSFTLALAGTAQAQENGLNEGHLSALDADGNSSISSEEFANFAAFAFTSMDTDKSGTLSPNEVAAHADADAFGRADTDGNGSITEAEFKARMDANFAAADKDGDGQLN